MKKSIRNVLYIGIISTIAGSIFILSLIFLFSTHSLLQNRAVSNTERQLHQIGGTIETFLSGVMENIDFLSKHPVCQSVESTQTNYLSPAGNANGRLLASDSVGRAMYDLLNLTEKSHDGYLDLYIGGNQGNFIIGDEVDLPNGYDPRTRPWYSDAMNKSGEVTVSPVYESATSNSGGPEAVITICKSIENNGDVSGVVGVDVSLSNITKMLKNMKIGENGAVALVQGDGTVIANPLDTTTNFVKASSDSAQVIYDALQIEPGVTKKVTIGKEDFLAYRTDKTLDGVDWTLIGFINVSEINNPLIKTAFQVVIFTLVILIVIYLLISIKTDKILISPLKSVTAFVSNISKGDFHSKIVCDREDEIGDIQAALITMADSLKEKTDLAQKISTGDLQDHGVLTSDKDALGQALYDMVESLNGVMGNMQNMITQVSDGSQQLAQASMNLSDGATHQASAVEEISSSMSEIESQVKKNAENAENARVLSVEGRQTAEVGSSQMQEMVSAMEEINNASNEISRIMKVIDDIAFQTNLLALNAAVEAARAGQHGKGFAVVADEVRNLAQRSAKASAETAHLIETAISKIEQGNSIAMATSESFKSIVEKITESADLVSNIASSSLAETTAIREIVSGVDQISHVTQETTANAEETSATSNELSHNAGLLRGVVNRFKLAGTGTGLNKSFENQSSPNVELPPAIEEKSSIVRAVKSGGSDTQESMNDGWEGY